MQVVLADIYPYHLSLVILAAKLAAAQGIASMPVLNTPVLNPTSANNEGHTSDEEEEEDDTVPAGTQPVIIDQGATIVPAVNGSSVKPDIESDNEEEKERKKLAEEEDLKHKQEEEEKAKELQRQQDRSRPVSSNPVQGTPWLVRIGYVD